MHSGEEIQVSPLDTRSYRHIELENGLHVLLISDMLSETAAASMDVSVGHFSDPWDIPGLAHFLEHMLFLGTEKYPDEGSFRQYISENGGSSNAYTAMEHTNYYFEVVARKRKSEESTASFSNLESNLNPSNEIHSVPSFVDTNHPRINFQEQDEHIAAIANNIRTQDHISVFHEALDRFAQFFIAPLFTEDATLREINAVDSENKNNLCSDSNRLYQLHKTLSASSHPYSKFDTGNAVTLRDDPEKNNIDVRKALLDFHSKYYSANLMRLCVVAPENLDILEMWVKQLFTQIENKIRPLPSAEYRGINLIESDNLPRKIFVVPLKEMRNLELMWIIPSAYDDYLHKSAQYLGHLIGHEGKGSLLSYLKKQGWVDNLCAGPSSLTNNFCLFDISMDLTTKGIACVDDIVASVLEYIQVIRENGVQEWIFEECKSVANMSFRFQERDSPTHLATRCSSDMSHYPIIHYLSGPSLYFEFSKDSIFETLDYLTAEKLSIFVVAKTFGNVVDTVEKWYGTTYAVEKVPDDLLQQWKGITLSNKELKIPPKNEFIPTDFSLLPTSINSDYPIRIRDDSKWRLHYKQDNKFRRPKVNVSVEMTSACYQVKTPRQAVLGFLWTELVKDDLNEFSYNAEIAGLYYEVYNTVSGIGLSIRGYNHRFMNLLKAIIERMASFKVNLNRFEFIRNSVEKDYFNFQFREQPYSYGIYSNTYLTEDPRFHVTECLEEIKCIEHSEVEEFGRKIIAEMHCEGLIHGNVTRETALATAELIEHYLKYKPLSPENRFFRRHIKIPRNKYGHNYVLRGPNDRDENSAIVVSYLIGQVNTKEDVLLELLCMVLDKPFFHELRTVQQLGYAVFSGFDRRFNVQSLRLIIQSGVASPEILNVRIEEFLRRFREDTLLKLTEGEFQKYVDSLRTLILDKPKRLSHQSDRYWSEITKNRYQYNNDFIQVECLEKISRHELVEFYDKYIDESGCERRKCITCIFGRGKDFPSTWDPIHIIDDPISYKKSSEMYPPVGYE